MLIMYGTWKDIGTLILQDGNVTVREMTVECGLVGSAINHSGVKDEVFFLLHSFYSKHTLHVALGGPPLGRPPEPPTQRS